MKTPDTSEDCLYLNVYTPSLPAEKLEKLPVVFFVHGGRFLVGYGDYYKPDYLIKNDVILVTINYRLHVLGFLCLHTPEVPGNAGIKDTVMALKWVQRNIRHFNGDETNVTAFGESAGAGLISSYITSKMADGLIHKIIAQSGVCLSDLFMIDEDPLEKAKNICSILGKETTDAQSIYDYLLTAPLDDLLSAALTIEYTKPSYIINSYFLAVVEKKFDGVDRFLEEYQLVTLMNNRHKKIPMLVGQNSVEAALFLRKDGEGNIEFIKDFQRFVPRFLGLKYDSPKSVQLARNLKDFYFNHKEVSMDSLLEYTDLASDAYFNRDVIMFTEAVAKYSNQIYFYNFCYSGNMNTRVMKNLGMTGATHGDTIQYQFYRKSKADKCDKNDENIVNFLSEAWCNFAKYG